VIKLGEQQSESKVTLVYGQMNEPPGEPLASLLGCQRRLFILFAPGFCG
jgi:hypothetical protein